MRTCPRTLTLALLTAGVASAQNDECVDAIAIGLGATAFDSTLATSSPEPWPCALGGGDLWWTYTAANDNDIRIETCGSTYDTALEVFEGSCGSLVSIACNDDSCGLQSAVVISGVTSGTTYTFRNGGFNGAVGTGTITISEMMPPPPPPAGCIETLFASNNGGSPGGAVYFDVTAVSPVEIGTVLANYAAQGLPVGIEVYTTPGTSVGNETDPGAWTLVAMDDGNAIGQAEDTPSIINLAAPFTIPAGTMGIALVAVGAGHEYTNGTGTNQSFTNGNLTIDLGGASNVPFTGGVFSPRVWNGGLCEAEAGTIGTNYCTAVANSTGGTASISATGSIVAADDDLTLLATGLPADEFGVLIMGFAPGSTTVGNGNLCLGLFGIARVAIDNSGAAGEITYPIGTSSVPTGNGMSITLSAGETWYFQSWYRDNAATGANFTDGVEITFQ